jgi:hypothetical protein
MEGGACDRSEVVARALRRVMLMFAKVGDRLVVPSRHVGGPVRDAEIIGVQHQDGTPPYLVRWSDDGHAGLFFPGPDAYVEHFENGSEPPT